MRAAPGVQLCEGSIRHDVGVVVWPTTSVSLFFFSGGASKSFLSRRHVPDRGSTGPNAPAGGLRGLGPGLAQPPREYEATRRTTPLTPMPTVAPFVRAATPYSSYSSYTNSGPYSSRAPVVPTSRSHLGLAPATSNNPLVELYIDATARSSIRDRWIAEERRSLTDAVRHLVDKSFM